MRPSQSSLRDRECGRKRSRNRVEPKNFPGLGGARVNSHHELTDISDTISDAQLRLFYELGQTISGMSIVVSHAIVHQWEKDIPVSMSPAGVGKVREHLPDVLLISDDLQMQGLQKKYSTQEACRLGLRAGLDMVCIANNLMSEDELVISYTETLSRQMAGDAALAEGVSRGCRKVAAAKREFLHSAT